MSDPLVLSYHDCVVRQSDLLLLERPHWINDRLIGFVFEYESSHHPSAGFITADVAQFVKFSSPDEVAMFLAPLELPSKDLVLITVNDNDTVDQSGGVHWSLLSFIRKHNAFYHYDSMSKHNTLQAQRIASNLNLLLSSTETPSFNDIDCPQQSNSYDCGMYTICYTRYVLQCHLAGETKSLYETITPEVVALKRKELKELITSLASSH
jgi:sentrin-specific protease 8